MIKRLANPIPTHMRYLEWVTCCIDHRVGLEPPYSPRQHAQARDIAFLAALEQHLQADADAEEGLGVGRIHHRQPQASRIEFSHAIRHCALPGKYDASGARNYVRIA